MISLRKKCGKTQKEKNMSVHLFVFFNRHSGITHSGINTTETMTFREIELLRN